MRDLYKELDKLIEFANNNKNIRGLVLQGSFINDKIETDDFSDLDPLFYVKDLSEFIEDDEWKTYFGKPISFFHDEGGSGDRKWYTRLTIYSDGFKIDFGFQSVKSIKHANDMELYEVYVDKDNVIPKPEVKDDSKFYIKIPTEEEYLERINTFFFDSSYVVKALARDEMFFEKYMEQVLKKKIHKLLEWHIGCRYDFKVNPGVVGRYIKKYLTDEEWKMLLKTYPDSNKSHCAKALIYSYDLVRYLGENIANCLDFTYPKQHELDMLNYCKDKINKYIETSK